MNALEHVQAAPAPRERPILFSGPLVRAILAGTKTQTRRPVKGLPSDAVNVRLVADTLKFGSYDTPTPHGRIPCPFGVPDDRLLVAREIPESPNDDYCAGSDGRIYSRTRYAGWGRKERVDWYPMEPFQRKGKGYHTVTLCHENRKVTKAVHRLVCSAFYGPAPFPGAQVRHLDGNPANNAPANLAWGTQAENWQDRRAQGHGCAGERHHAAKLTDEERAHVRWALQRGLCSQKHAARVLGMSQSSMGGILQGAELRQTSQDVPEGRIPRLTLEVESVRVERLQAITEEDARAEGTGLFESIGPDQRLTTGERFGDAPHRAAFACAWDGIYADAGLGWQANPFVWVVSFRRVQP